jgi:hypothetical protein
VGADPTLIGAHIWIELAEELEDKGIILVDSLPHNLIDQVWTEGDGRPPFVVCITKS